MPQTQKSYAIEKVMDHLNGPASDDYPIPMIHKIQKKDRRCATSSMFARQNVWENYGVMRSEVRDSVLNDVYNL